MEKIRLIWNAEQCGVYCIRNKVNGKVYIGSSRDCYHRVRGQHFAKLQANSHSNPHLQSAWNKYGKQKFDSFCVEICDEHLLSKKEEYWMTKTRCIEREFGYNINKKADRKTYTEEQKIAVSLRHIGQQRRSDMPSGIWKSGKHWIVTICFRKQDYYLGTFDNLTLIKRLRTNTIERLKIGLPPDWKTINRFRITQKHPVLKIKDGKIVEKFESVNDAHRAGFDPKSIKKCCLKKQKIHKGFEWKYDDKSS